MLSIDWTVSGVPSEIDAGVVEREICAAIDPLLRRRGGRRGENLIGVVEAAEGAAEREIQRQIDEAT